MFFLIWFLTVFFFLSDQIDAASSDATFDSLIPTLSACDFSLSPVCDPDRVLGKDERKSLELILSSGIGRTVCFCNEPCYLRGFDKHRLAFGILFFKHASPPSKLDGQHLAEKLRSHFAIGSCQGNDVFILATEKDIFVSYGPLIVQKLLPCMQNLDTKYDGSTHPIKRIHQLTFTLKSLLVQSCVCRICDAPQFWFKMVAMLLASMSLIIWMTLFGRRIYMRRFSVIDRDRFPVYHESTNHNSLFSPRYGGSGLDSRRQITLDRGQSRINMFGRADLSRPARLVPHSSPPPPVVTTRCESPPPPDYSQVSKCEPIIIPSEIPKSNSSNATTNPIDCELDTSPPSYADVLACSQQRQQRQNPTSSTD